MVLAQIQNMREIEDAATEFENTPFASVWASARPSAQRVVFAFTRAFTAKVDYVYIGFLVVSETTLAQMGGSTITVRTVSPLYNLRYFPIFPFGNAGVCGAC